MIPINTLAQGTASEAYAVLSESNTVLTFYFDDQKDARSGMGLDANNWYSHNSEIVSVVFDASFVSYNDLTSTVDWFNGFSNLQSITGISNLKTDNVNDMSGMFAGCSLSFLDLSGFKTNNVNKMNYMFFSCSNLKGIYVGSGWSVDAVTESTQMFKECNNLVGGAGTTYSSSNIDYTYARIDGGVYEPGYLTNKNLPVPYALLSNENTVLTFYYDNQKMENDGMNIGPFSMFNNNRWDGHATDITSVVFDDSFTECTTLTSTACWFYQCSNLANITGISNLKTDNVTNMERMFYGCSSLTSLDVSGFNTGNVTDMFAMFEGCSNLETIDVSHFNTANVTSMGYMFDGCSKLTELDLSNFNTSNLTSMELMFMGCSRLTSLDVSSFNTANVVDMDGVFRDCSGLKSLDLSNFNTANVNDMSNMFAGCNNLLFLDLTSFNTANVTSMSRMFYGCSRLVNLDLSSFNTGNVINMREMFYYCSHLITIYAGSGWNNEKVSDSTGLFGYCPNLIGGSGTKSSEGGSELSYAHIDEGSTNPGYFTDIADKESVLPYAVLSEEDTKLTFYYDDQKYSRNGIMVESKIWFYSSDNITTVVFDDSFANCSVLTSLASLFSSCENLTTITGLEYLKTDNVTDMSSMFYNCSKLTSIDLRSFNTANVTDMSQMFSGCTQLTTLDLSSFDTQKVENMSNMFSACTSLTTIYVGNEWATDAVTYSYLMFYICNNLIGGKGTTFDDQYDDVTYAHIDGGTTNPGYFTNIAEKDKAPYAVLTDNDDDVTADDGIVKGKTLTFYYDNQKQTRNGLDVSLEYGVTKWNSNKKIITSVVFDESFANCMSLTSTALWFNDCSNLTSVTGIGNLKTNNVTDMSGMFGGCSSLASLDVSSFNTAKVTSMSNMFWNCRKLTSLDVSGFITDNVTDLGYMFWGCAKLTSLDISGFNTDNVSFMGYMFNGCTNLTSLDVSGFKTDNVTYMDGLFGGCSSLTSLDVSGFKTSNLTTIRGLFTGCTNLVSINLTGFKTDNITDISNMFEGCSSLASLDLSSFNTENVENMNSLFRGCSKLTTLDLSGFSTAKVSDMVSMFGECSSLTTIYVGDLWSNAGMGEDTSKSIGMFNNCSLLVGENGTNFDAEHIDHTYAHIDGGTANPGYFTNVIYKGKSDEPYAVLSSDNKTLTFYYDKKKETRSGMSVGPFTASNERGWYSARNTIETVVFDETFANCTSITSTAHWFDTLTGLSSISGIERLNTSGVTDMNSMFNYCFNLEEVDLSTFNTANVTDMNNMFAGCSGLTTLNFGSGFNTEKVTTMERMFIGCGKLTSLDLSRFNTANVTDMSEMFSDCTKLTSLDVSSFNTAKVTDMERTFRLLQHVETLDLSSFNTAAVTNMNSMFYDCNALKTILVSVDGWSITALTDDENMFAGCLVLVGDQGTSYNEDNPKDKTYAHIDGGTANPGYLTDARPMEPYAVLNDERTELTFYYDKKKEERNGLSVSEIESGTQEFKRNLTTVVFDDSFADCATLNSTASWFKWCYNLTSITGISNLKTENVTSMSMMFYQCSSLTSLDLSGFNTSKVTSMNRMFEGCEKMVDLDLSSFETSSVTDMDRMFFGCFRLVTVYVSENWTTSNVTQHESMFGQTGSLIGGNGTTDDNDHLDKEYARIDTKDTPGYFTLGSFNSIVPYAVLEPNNLAPGESVTEENADDVKYDLTLYYDNNKITRNGFRIPGANGYYEDELPVWYNYQEKVTSVVIDRSFSNCSTLVSTVGWFSELKYVTVIEGLENLKTDNVVDMSEMFSGCQNLNTLDVSGFNTSKVTNMRNMFRMCSALKEIDVSKFNTSQVTDMSNMFCGCGFETLSLNNFNTENVKDMSCMFGGLSVSSLDLSSFNTQNVENMYQMFDDCENITTLDLSSFNTSNVTNMKFMFEGCKKLSAIYVGSEWTISNVTEGGAMFDYCTSLVGGSGTTFDAEHIGYTYAHIDGGAENPGYFTDKYGVTITAKDCTREYGDANPTFEFTATGASISGTPTITCDATATSPIGTYPITVSYTKAEGESALNVTCINGTLTITKAPLKVTAKSYTIKRGGELPTFEVEYSGFKNNEIDTVFTKKPVITCEAKADTVPGTYQIIVSDAEAKNYEIKYVFGSLTITDDAIVTANSYSRVYGDDNPTFEYSVDGATLSGIPSITCAATATSPVGTYDIVIAKGDVTNSEVTFVNGTLTITKAPLTITAKSYTIKQGKDLPTLELEYSGLKNNETDTVFTTKPVVSTTATKYSEPGSYDITVKDAEAANYEITFVKGTLTITKKTETYDGSSNVLTVEEGGNIDDALENIGGRDEVAKSIAAIIWNSSIALTSDMLKGFDNPNMLIYVASKDQAPEGRDNVVIDGVASYIRLTDSDTGNNNFYAPKEFTADSIAYTREFKQETRKNVSRGWEGICLPFTVQTFTHESHGEIVPFGNSASKYHFWLHQFTEDGIVNAETIEANKPYLISMPNSNEYYEEFNQAGVIKFASANVKVPVTEAYTILIGDTAQIVPTFQEIDASEYIYALNVSDSILTNPEGSIFVSNYRKVRPFEIYTFHEPSHKDRYGSRIISLSSLSGGNDTTGINDVMIAPNSDVWYDLSGRRLQSKPSKGGLYIHNGRKIVIK